MALMQWSEKMSVGVIELDADHKELIKVINRLGAIAEDQARQNAIRQSLFALLRYAEYHFAREEPGRSPGGEGHGGLPVPRKQGTQAGAP